MRWCRGPAALLAAIIAITNLSISAASPSPISKPAPPAFTYDRTSFYLHGSPYVIIGGQMDPQRIPAAYWRDRLAKARAMGLNTIFSYVYWNLMEPSPGEWRGGRYYGGGGRGGSVDIMSNDIAAFFRIAQEEGLNVILRPGPYICGEREWGGFPVWLAQIPGMQVRSSNVRFMEAAKRYLVRLAADLKDAQVTRGGPLLMVQVENEYGSYGEDHIYTAGLRDILRENFDVPLYTNDGGVDWTLAGGEVPGVLAEIDGDPWSGFAAREEYITRESELGPLVDGEYYTLAPDFWGAENAHNTTVGRPGQIAQFMADLDYVLGANNSISLYMFHGGTNFGFSNGAIWKNFTASFTTSYDYGSPLDESGRTAELYFTLRDAISKYVPAGTIPEPPENLPRLEIPAFELTPLVGLFDILGHGTWSETPLTMEQLGQAYGFILYEHTVDAATLSGILQPGDRARDRVIVYVNGVRKGVIDSTYPRPAEVSVSLRPGDKLQLLVENLGRVDYWSRESGTFVALEDPYKGIRGNVTVGLDVLLGWSIHSLPLEAPPSPSKSQIKQHAGSITAGSPPMFYHATFDTGHDGDGDTDPDPARLDTFLAVPDGIKGNVWVNGFNLGRYWIIGPQQSLYLPGTLLKPVGKNEVVVLELEPSADTLTVFGAAEREWGNHPDPDW